MLSFQVDQLTWHHMTKQRVAHIGKMVKSPQVCRQVEERAPSQVEERASIPVDEIGHSQVEERRLHTLSVAVDDVELSTVPPDCSSSHRSRNCVHTQLQLLRRYVPFQSLYSGFRSQSRNVTLPNWLRPPKRKSPQERNQESQLEKVAHFVKPHPFQHTEAALMMYVGRP